LGIGDFLKRPQLFISIEEAQNRLLRVLSERVSLSTERVHIVDSLSRVASELIRAPMSRPRTNLSAVDGYAVRSLDTTGASIFNPIELIVKSVLKPGEDPDKVCIEPGYAIRVHTGAPVPCKADAVIMDEDVKVQGSTILIQRSVAPGSNIILRGEDIEEGDVIVKPGLLIQPAHIAALASLGIDTINVYRKIRVSLIAIGDELIEPGHSLNYSKEFNSSTYIIYAQLVKDGIFQVRYAGIVPDDVKTILTTIKSEFERGSDIIITTGGTGVGETDKVSELLEKYSSLIFRGVKMRPGRMTSASLMYGKPIIHLSGFPVAAWAGYELILRPAIAKWIGIEGFERPVIYAYLSRRVPNISGYNSIIRVALTIKNGEYYAEPYMLRGSGVISSLLKTHGYIIIPENIEGFEEGEKVPVYLYR
jgi:molybdopterin molybdotransferase